MTSQISWEEAVSNRGRGHFQHNVPTRYSGSVYSRVWSWSPISSLSGASGNRWSGGNQSRWSGQQGRLFGNYQAQQPAVWNIGQIGKHFSNSSLLTFTKVNLIALTDSLQLTKYFPLHRILAQALRPAHSTPQYIWHSLPQQ